MKRHILYFVAVSPFILIGCLLATYFRGQQFVASDILGQFITGLILAILGYLCVNKFVFSQKINS